MKKCEVPGLSLKQREKTMTIQWRCAGRSDPLPVANTSFFYALLWILLCYNRQNTSDKLCSGVKQGIVVFPQIGFENNCDIIVLHVCFKNSLKKSWSWPVKVPQVKENGYTDKENLTMSRNYMYLPPTLEGLCLKESICFFLSFDSSSLLKRESFCREAISSYYFPLKRGC